MERIHCSIFVIYWDGEHKTYSLLHSVFLSKNEAMPTFTFVCINDSDKVTPPFRRSKKKSGVWCLDIIKGLCHSILQRVFYLIENNVLHVKINILEHLKGDFFSPITRLINLLIQYSSVE